MEFIIYLSMGMVWVLSGLFVAFLMAVTDDKKSHMARYTGYWIKYKKPLPITTILILIAPISLIIGAVVLTEYITMNE